MVYLKNVWHTTSAKQNILCTSEHEKGYFNK